MQTIRGKLWRAQAEVQRAAHDQDLVEVPKRALLDRAAEGTILPTGGAEAHGEINEDSVFDPASAQK
jgi:hypothetical protein